MKNLVYDIHKLVENFLQHIHFEKNKLNKSNMLLSEYMLRHLNKQFEKEAKHAKDLLDNSKIDLIYYQDKLNFETQYHNYFYTKKLGMERYQNTDEFNLSSLKFCFTNFFDRNYTLIFSSDHLKKNFNMDLVNYVIKFFENSPLNTDDEVLIFYYALVMAYNKDDVKVFYKLKSLIEKNYFRYSKKQQYDFYIRLCDFCARRFNIDLKFSNEMFEICKSMLDKGLYTNGVSKYMHYFLYVCISEAALFSKEFEWAKKFIEDYKEKLDPEFQEVYYNKALISYFFVTKDFGKTLELLSKIKITTQTDKLTIKQFQFMCYYELNYVEELNLLIDSSRHYVSIDKNISENKGKMFLEFINVIKKLISIKSEINIDKNILFQIENLKKEILSKEISNKIWFNKKLDELNSIVRE